LSQNDRSDRGSGGVPTVSQRIAWQPTVEDLCEQYDLDEDICEDDGDHYEDDDYKQFKFDIICVADQLLGNNNNRG